MNGWKWREIWSHAIDGDSRMMLRLLKLLKSV